MNLELRQLAESEDARGRKMEARRGIGLEGLVMYGWAGRAAFGWRKTVKQQAARTW